MANILYMLLGAALVAIGILATALADRIRGASREIAPRKQVNRPASIPVIEPADLLRAMGAPAAKPRAPRESKPQADGADDVIAALVAAGYKKALATEAAWACSSAERATVENWTRHALRRCVKGGAS